MGRLNNDEQFKFLISCIRWSNNGKVDFGEVAKECKIVTKGAAAKRYERMMKAHGIHQPASSRDSVVPPLRRKEGVTSTPSKKRKHQQFSSECGSAVDDDEGLGNVKDEIVYPESGTSLVKEELGLHNSNTDMMNYPWLYGTGRSNTNLSNDNDAFNDFIVSGAFEPINTQPGYGTGLSQANAEESVRLAEGGEMQESILILD